MAGVLQLSAVSIVAKPRECRSNEGCGQNGIFRDALILFLSVSASGILLSKKSCRLTYNEIRDILSNW